MSPLDKLIAYFEKFPGVGQRQARRFAFHILTLKNGEAAELASLITALPDSVTECASCRRFFASVGQSNHCTICTNSNRDHTKLMVVARDSDIQAIERSGVYDGLYFVLGGTIPLLQNNESITGKLRSGALKAIIESRLNDGLTEVICAFAVNPDGENTTRYTEKLISEIPGSTSLKISQLGRGLSTGSELEYADPETIKSALRNRS